MSMLPILAKQILIMFVLMLVGFVLNRKHLLTGPGSGDIARILLHLVIPSVIIKSFQAVSFSPEMLKELGISFVMTLTAIIFSILISRLCFKKDPLEQFAAAFDNPGFVGLPLVTAALGEANVIYAVPFITFIGFFQWTYGVYMLTGDRSSMSLKKVLLNPIFIGFWIGLLLFLLPFGLPTFCMELLGGVAALNTPLAMILLGFYLGGLRLRELFSGKNVIKCMLVRLLLIPLLTIGLLTLIPAKYMMIRQALLILAAAPVGTNVAMFTQLYNGDYPKAAKEVSLSTLLCIVSIPLIVAVANLLWGVA